MDNVPVNQIGEQELKNHFSQYGHVGKMKLSLDTRRCHVNLSNWAATHQALLDLDGNALPGFPGVAFDVMYASKSGSWDLAHVLKHGYWNRRVLIEADFIPRLFKKLQQTRNSSKRNSFARIIPCFFLMSLICSRCLVLGFLEISCITMGCFLPKGLKPNSTAADVNAFCRGAAANQEFLVSPLSVHVTQTDSSVVAVVEYRIWGEAADAVEQLNNPNRGISVSFAPPEATSWEERPFLDARSMPPYGMLLRHGGIVPLRSSTLDARYERPSKRRLKGFKGL